MQRFNDHLEEGGTAWGDAGATLFDGLLDDPDIETLTFRDSVARFEGSPRFNTPKTGGVRK